MIHKVTWTGKSGSEYEFEAYVRGATFYDVSGVYIAARQLATGNVEALYVGQTESFYDRLNAGAANHEGLRCANLSGMTHICALVVPDYAERLRIETDLRHGLNPSCNKQDVPRHTNALRW